MLGGRLATSQKSRFQAAKLSNMGSALQQFGIFPDSQKSRFKAKKRLHMCSAILEEGRFADTQESRFQARIFQIYILMSCKRVDYLLHRNRFSVCAVPCYNMYDLMTIRICVFSVRKV